MFNFMGMSPLEVLLYSGLGGMGIYGGLKAFRDLGKITAEEKKDPKLLTINVPSKQKTLLPKTAEAPQDWNSHLLRWLALGTGIPAGFYAAGKMINHPEKVKQEQALQKAQQEYEQTLQGMRQKMGSVATPATDAFCEKIAEQLEKTAIMGFMNPFRPLPMTGVSLSEAAKNVATQATPTKLTSLVSALALLSTPVFYKGIKNLAEQKKKSKKELPQIVLDQTPLNEPQLTA
jgi:hypothetical protein